MKEYKSFMIGRTVEITGELLNSLAKEGWRLVCSYGKNNIYLIVESNKRELKGGKNA